MIKLISRIFYRDSAYCFYITQGFNSYIVPVLLTFPFLEYIDFTIDFSSFSV